MSFYFLIVLSILLGPVCISNSNLTQENVSYVNWIEEDEEEVGFSKKITTNIGLEVTTPKLETVHNGSKESNKNLTEEVFFSVNKTMLARENINMYFNNMRYNMFSPWHKLSEQNLEQKQFNNMKQQETTKKIEYWEEDEEISAELASNNWWDELERELNPIKRALTTKRTVDRSLKYILLWTYNDIYAYKWDEMDFPYYGGQQIFIDKNCSHMNCYVTNDRTYIDNDHRKFDAIVFLAPDVFSAKLPWKRSPHQKYIFATIESSDNYPVCTNTFNGFFNWTWTYKLDSDARWGYIYVRDSNKRIIGPKMHMHWIAWKDMAPIGFDLKEKLRTKTKAAAWFVSNCWTVSHREDFVKALKQELTKYDLGIDIFGKCAEWECGKHKHAECLKMLEKDYFFYLSFENALSEDYVTEKLLHALQSNTVPIVFGGANYTRFMPDGMYLNAQELGVEKLASTMNYLIKERDEYFDYFRWQNHYSFHGNKQLDFEGYCRICNMLNNDALMAQTTVYDNFKEWWTPPHKC